MSFRLSRCFKGYLAVAALVCGGLWVPAGLAQSKLTQETEAQSPPSSTSTNLSAGATRPILPMNGLLRLEEQLSHTFQFLKPSNPVLDAVPSLPLPARVAAPAPNRRVKDLLEQNKDWIFMNPDDLTKAPKPEEVLNLPQFDSGGLNDKSLTPVQRFYQDLDRREIAKTKKANALTADDPTGLREQFKSARNRETEDPSLPTGIRDNEQKLRKLLGLDNATAAATAPRSSFSDVFGLSEKSTTPTEYDLARKAYLDGFHEWLNRSALPTANNGLALPPGAMDPMSPRTAPVGTLPSFAPLSPVSRPDNYDPSIGTVNPTIAASAPQDITAKVLNQWNPYYVPPKLESPKSPPPQPVFDVPRRKF